MDRKLKYALLVVVSVLSILFVTIRLFPQSIATVSEVRDKEAFSGYLQGKQVPKWMLSETTSRVFSGGKTRVFPRRDVEFKFFSTEKPTHRKEKDNDLQPWCKKWGVVTTIFDVSEAVRRQVKIVARACTPPIALDIYRNGWGVYI